MILTTCWRTGGGLALSPRSPGRRIEATAATTRTLKTTMYLDELQKSVDELTPLLKRRFGPPGQFELTRLLVTAALQLDAARLGQRLLDLKNSNHGNAILALLGESETTLEMAATNLVCRNAATTLDLCAAVIMRLHGSAPADGREADVEWYIAKRITGLRSPWKEWITNLQANAHWQLLKRIRDMYTHRWVRRDVTVGVGSNTFVRHEIVINNTAYEIGTLLHQCFDLADREFKAFVTLILNECKRSTNG